MLFLPTVNLWDNAINQAVSSGQLKLQTGQWVQCGPTRSRFVCVRPGGSIWCVHPDNSKGIVKMPRFSEAVKSWKPKKN